MTNANAPSTKTTGKKQLKAVAAVLTHLVENAAKSTGDTELLALIMVRPETLRSKQVIGDYLLIAEGAARRWLNDHKASAAQSGSYPVIAVVVARHMFRGIDDLGVLNKDLRDLNRYARIASVTEPEQFQARNHLLAKLRDYEDN